MELNEKTKKSIEKMVGLPFEKFLKMDPLQEKAYVEKKTGKKLGWKEGLYLCVKNMNIPLRLQIAYWCREIFLNRCRK